MMFAWAVAAPTALAAPVFTPEDIFRIQEASDSRISPDGRQVAFVRRSDSIETDRSISTLWVVDATGGPPRRLVSGSGASPRWSPDGARIAFLAADPQGATQIQLIASQGGVVAPLTHLAQAPQDLAWSPDGRTIAFCAFVPAPAPTLGAPIAEPPGAKWAPPLRFIASKNYLADGEGYVPAGHAHIFLVDVASGAVRQLTTGTGDEASPAWAPDSRALVYSSKGIEPPLIDYFASRLYEVDVASGRVRRMSPDPVVASSPAVSPDGRHVVFIGSTPPKPGGFFAVDAYVMDRDGSHVRVLAPTLDRVVANPQWSADGDAVVASYVDRGVGKIARFGLDGGVHVVAHDAEDSFSVARNGAIAFALEGADHPADVGLASGGAQRRLTRLNDSWLSALNVGAVKPLPVRSSVDGAEVGAWMVLPPGYRPGRRYPTILAAHGGPYGQDGPQWRSDYQLFAAAGYVVLYANYRGSTSYGLKFSAGIDRDFPGPAFDDLMSAVKAAVAAGVADPERLFVTGASAGGELTAWIVGQTHRFRAAAALKPVIDLFSHSLANDQYLYGATDEFGVTPWADPMMFWRHSPLSLVANVTTPTLLIVGEDDHRTPPGQSMEFYDALQIRGVPTGLVIVPGVGHEGLASRPSQRAAEDVAILAWFARYGGLKPQPSAAR